MENLYWVDRLLIFFALGALYVIATELRACRNILEAMEDNLKAMEDNVDKIRFQVEK